MAKLTTFEFVEYLRHSKLVAEEDLNRSLEKYRQDRGGELPDNAELVAILLIEAGLITRWHADKLFDMKYKGFYLGKYKLLSLLGWGEMSSVYLAEHVQMKRLRAIKVLPKSCVNKSSYLARFHLEAQVVASFDHPNIVRAYDVDNDGEQHFLVMEYIDGKDLQKIVTEQGPLALELACNYIAQAAEGLAYAHQHNLIHCDVKPANLMIDGQGTVRILDMGLAIYADGFNASIVIPHYESVLGTADYLAPEQALDSPKLDARTDIYSLGCTFYFLLTRHPLFPNGSLLQRAVLHLRTMPVNVSQDRPDCPDDLSAICCKMLQKNPDHRYQSMREVIEALEAWLAKHGYDYDPGPSVVARKAVALKGSKRSGRIAQNSPKKRQLASTLRFPVFPLPGSGNQTSRILLICLVATLLIVATSMLVAWLVGYR